MKQSTGYRFRTDHAVATEWPPLAIQRNLLTRDWVGSLLLIFLFTLVAGTATGSETSASQTSSQAISEARIDENGFRIHRVESAYQKGTTEIQVLLPERFDPNSPLRTLYVLPVEAGNENRYGNGLTEIKANDLHNKYQLVCVQPTFSHLPWYGDHPTDPTIRQEGYLLNVVLPFVERTYPVKQQADARLLVGFSKSGWGAYSLLLRNPKLFGKASAWDTPFLLGKPGRFNTKSIFATQENFENYRIMRLLEQRKSQLGGETRLMLLGYETFRPDHQRLHTVMTDLGIPHVYRDGPFRKHVWGSGWLPEAVQLLANPLAHSPQSVK